MTPPLQQTYLIPALIGNLHGENVTSFVPITGYHLSGGGVPVEEVTN